jgi:hypothetical protein
MGAIKAGISCNPAGIFFIKDYIINGQFSKENSPFFYTVMIEELPPFWL